MEIDKDPYVTNLLSENAYIRMKIEFIDSDGGTVASDISGKLFNYYGAYNSDTTSETTQCQIVEDNKDWKYIRFLSTVYYNTTDDAGKVTYKHLVNIDNDTSSGSTEYKIKDSNNPYFKYYDGWFYYLDYENTDENSRSNLKKMAYKERTSVPLFTDIKLPVFKDEYNDLFAKGFRIKVTVQAVNANEFTGKNGDEYIPDTSAMNDIIEVFKSKFNDT